MKEKFLFYYEEPDLNKLWEECTFIFDTNILLNLYRYPKETSEDLIKILEKDIPSRLWMPHQVAFEYQEGRYKVIKDQKKFYKNLKGKIKGAQNDFNQKLDSEGLFKQDHYFLNPNKLRNEIKKELDDICTKFKKIIDEEQSKNHDFLTDDIIRSKLDHLFNGNKLGDKLQPEKLVEIIEEGQARYSLKIPPGYGDKKKSIPEKFGDLIIWYQIIKYAKENEKSIIFVTEDKTKEDWLIKVENRLVPRNSLIQEFYDKTDGQIVHIYDFKQFMDKSEEYLGIKYNTKTKEDVEKLEFSRHIGNNIEFRKIEMLDKTRPLAISFLLMFEIDESFDDENKRKLIRKLKNYSNHFKDVGYEFDVESGWNETFIGIIIHYPMSKWPDDPNKAQRIIEKYIKDFINYYQNPYNTKSGREMLY